MTRNRFENMTTAQLEAWRDNLIHSPDFRVASGSRRGLQTLKALRAADLIQAEIDARRDARHVEQLAACNGDKVAIKTLYLETGATIFSDALDVIEAETPAPAKTEFFGIWWKGDSVEAAQFCETYRQDGKTVCYDAYSDRAKAEAHCAALTPKGPYEVRALPAGFTVYEVGAPDGTPPVVSTAHEESKIPAYSIPVWENGRVVNKSETPFWSGMGAPPAIGSEVVCNDRVKTRVMVTGYEIEHGWLMLQGYRVADPSHRGNLAGAEILYPTPKSLADVERYAMALDELELAPNGDDFNEVLRIARGGHYKAPTATGR